MSAPKNSKARRSPEVSKASEPSSVVPFEETDDESELKAEAETGTDHVSDSEAEFESEPEGELEPETEGEPFVLDEVEFPHGARVRSEVKPGLWSLVDEAFGASEPSGVVHTHVRVRSAHPKLRGCHLRGRPLTAEGFSVALADLPPGELEHFRAEPLAIVELYTPEG